MGALGPDDEDDFEAWDGPIAADGGELYDEAWAGPNVADGRELYDEFIKPEEWCVD